MDDLGVSLFSETSISINIYTKTKTNMEPKIQASLCFEHAANFDEKLFDCVIFDSRIVGKNYFWGSPKLFPNRWEIVAEDDACKKR